MIPSVAMAARNIHMTMGRLIASRVSHTLVEGAPEGRRAKVRARYTSTSGAVIPVLRPLRDLDIMWTLFRNMHGKSPKARDKMAMAMQRQLVTVEEFEKYPRDFPFNLIEGELVPMPPPAGPDHGAITFDLSIELGNYV